MGAHGGHERTIARQVVLSLRRLLPRTEDRVAGALDGEAAAGNAFTARIAAPVLLFKSEAIVHPDEVASCIAPEECQPSYSPLWLEPQ